MKRAMKMAEKMQRGNYNYDDFMQQIKCGKPYRIWSL